MKVAENFDLQEFVPEEIFKKWQGSSLWFVDPRIIQTAQALRDEFGPMTINDKYRGGTYNYSGFRQPSCTIGAKMSQHRFGRAIDCKFKDITVQEAYASILADQSYWISKGITTLENIDFTKSWLHVDIRETGMNRLKIVNP